MRQTLRELRQ